MTEEKEKSLQNADISEKPDPGATKEITGEAAESQLEPVKYPKSVFFIIGNEFCERFSFYGMRTVLSLYLRDVLRYTESDSIVIYHVFTSLAYFFPVLGAIISDSWLGKFRTILYVSLIYAAGNILLALASATPIGMPKIPFSLLALLLIALGTGGIKPCVSAFGGDQFVMPQQEKQLAQFFSVFYFSINAGSLISTFLTPVLREDVHCFGDDTCYPLAFLIPGILMIVSVVIFFLGMPLYRMKKPEGNVMVTVAKCIGHGVKKNIKSDKKVHHWLDHSKEKYGDQLVQDIKSMLKVLVIFIPLPIFFALYDQQGSGWTFQAARMNGKLGSFTLLPDQFQVVNPILILVFIPLFNYWIYPFFARFNILRTPLQRMVWGGLLVALSFGISAGVSFALEATYPVLPESGHCQLRAYNPSNDKFSLEVPDFAVKIQLPELGYNYVNIPKVDGDQNASFTLTSSTGSVVSGQMAINEKTGVVFWTSDSLGDNTFWDQEDAIDKPEDGLPLIRTLVYNPTSSGANLTYLDGTTEALSVNSTDSSLLAISPGVYKLGPAEVEFLLGGVYTVLVALDDSANETTVQSVKYYQITEPNSVHMMWLLPQYFIITAGEILYSITGLEFSYSEAPASMKSVMTAAWLLTSAVGDLIIVIIESAKIFDKKSYDFLLYTGLMVVDMAIFAWMAVKYKYVHDYTGEKKETEERKESSSEEKY